MSDDDFTEFGDLLDSVCSLLSRGQYTPNATNTALFFRALSAHPLPEVRAGFDAHVGDAARGRFVPVPADILAQIEARAAVDGRPGSEEAWAMALRAADEDATVVWTVEMAGAWAVAKPVADGGDEVGARMAFKEVYARLVADARAARQATNWDVSLGFDADRRDDVLEKAREAGRIHAGQIGYSGGGDVPLLTGPTATGMPAAVREKLMALRDALTRSYDGPSINELQRERTEALKAEQAAKVAAYGRLQ